jgi:hypothetical protein
MNLEGEAACSPKGTNRTRKGNLAPLPIKSAAGMFA